MKIVRQKIYIIAAIIFACTIFSHAQTKRQFSGAVDIIPSASLANNQQALTLTCVNENSNFAGVNAQIGDIIIDPNGYSYEIVLFTTAPGSTIYCIVNCLDKIDASSGRGVIFRPTTKGLYLSGADIPSNVLSTAINAALLGLDGQTANYYSGATLPASSGYTIGDAIFNSVSSTIYTLTASGWSVVSTGIQDAYEYPDPVSASRPPESSGTIVKGFFDGQYYICDGTTWKLVPSVTSLPTTYKYGDVFYTTNDNKLYMMGEAGSWIPISSSSIPAGPLSNRPATAQVGDFFFDNGNNILYVYDTLGRWVVVSINGSTPKGTTNPNSSITTVKEGELFYNTTDKKLYFYNGTTWMSTSLSLNNGEIFVGNASNAPASVPLSGDATINNLGQMTIKNGAITNAKLDKANIPISGFGLAQGDVNIGASDGSTTYQIHGVAIPTLFNDVAPKGWVEMLFTTPALLGLNNNSMFVGNTSNRATMVLKSAVPISDFGKAAATVNMGTAGGPYYNISNLANPTAAQDAATKYYVDNRIISSGNIALSTNQILVGTAVGVAAPTLKSATPLSDWGAPVNDILMGGKSIKNMLDPTSAQDAATKNYVDSKTLTLTNKYIFEGDATNMPVGVPKTSVPLSDWGAAIANVSMGGTNLTNLAQPVNPQDAATKKYVDDKGSGTTTGTTPPASPSAGTTYYNTTDHTFYVYDGSTWVPVNNILPTGQFYVGDASNKATPTTKSAITLSGFGDAQANVSMGNGSNNYKIINLAQPSGNQDAATKKYVDDKVGSINTGTTPPATPTTGTTYYNTTDHTFYVYDGSAWVPVNNILPTGQLYVGDASNKAAATAKNTIPLSGFAAAGSDVDLGSNKLINVAQPVNPQDAATKKYVDDKGSGTTTGTTPPTSPNAGATYYNTTDHTFYVYDGTSWIPVNNLLPTGQLYVGDASGKAAATAKNTIPLSGFAAAASNVDFGSNKLINVSDPSTDQDAATKKYVDTKVGSITTGTTPPATPTTGTTYYNTTDKTFYVYDGTSWVPVNNLLPTGQLYVGDASGKAAATAKNTIPLSGFAAAASSVDLGTNKLINVSDPSTDQDAATKKYVDTKVGSITTGTTPPATPTTGTTYYNTTDKTFYVYDGTSWVPVNNILPNGQLYVGDASNKAAATPKSSITLSGFGDAQANISMGNGSNNYKIINLGQPAGDNDAATKKYVDDKTGSINTGTTPPATPTTGTTYYNTTDHTFYVYDGSAWVPVNNILPNGQLYVGDASNKAKATAKNTIPLSGFAAAASSVDMGTNKLINVAAPTTDQDAATKKYVDDKTGSINTGTTPPATPTTGTTYYNTTDHTFYVYDGTSWVPVNNILPNGELYVGDASNKAAATPKSSITLSGFGDAQANISMGNGSNNYKIINLGQPAGDNDAATKKYVDDKTSTLNTGTTPPASPTIGTTYYNTNDKIFYVYDGTGWVPVVPGDNLGNHIATKNVQLAAFAINNDGQNNKGLTFDAPGNATFAQDVTVKGNFYTPSDLRLKTKIETLSKTLQAINQLRGVRFEYKDQTKYAKGPKIGVIAQELQRVFPEMVTKGQDGYLKVDYTQLSAVLIQAVKEQQEELEALKNKLDAQQAQINSILKKLEK